MPEPLPQDHPALPTATPGEGGASLPAVPADAELADVVDGEIVEEPEPQRPVYVLQQVVQIAQTINVVVQHPGTRTAGRHVSYVALGIAVAARRRRRRRTLAAQMAEVAAARGETDKAKEWAELDHRQRQERAERRREALEAGARVIVLLPRMVIGAAVVLVALSLLLCLTGGGLRGAEEPWRAAATVVGFGLAAGSDAWKAAKIALYGVPAGLLLWLWHIGRTADGSAGWSVDGKPGKEERGLIVTADGITLALQHTPIPDLRKAFKAGWRPAFHTTPVKDGEGYFAVFSLPYGVTPAMLADKVDVFARNLHRAKTEVWPTDAEREKIAPAGYVALWVANPGVLDRPAPEYPLLHEGQADVFEGVPGGVTARGDLVLIPVVSNNLVLGGQMGQGKSNGCRVFMLGCATDPLCELDAFVFAGNGDFDSFGPRLANYFKGTGDEIILAAVGRLGQLLEEVERRELRLAELKAKKLTRHLAETNPDLHPIVSLYSECHELFGHSEYGEIAAELAVKIIKRARKTGIVLAFDTQSSRAGAIPSELVELVSVNGCFYVKTWRSNDGFLGDGSFQSGIRATELRPGRDRGRSLITGVSDAQFELLKWFFVEVDDDTGFDAATEVIERCMRRVLPGTLVAGGAPVDAIVVRDLLDDLGEVVDAERVKLADLPPRLRKLAATWPEYRSMSGKDLKKRLDELDVRTVNPGNVPQLDAEDLQRAIARRRQAVS